VLLVGGSAALATAHGTRIVNLPRMLITRRPATLSGQPAEGPLPLPVSAAVSRPGSAQPRMLFGGGRRAQTPLEQLGRSLRGIGWLSWWTQVILSTVSGVLLLFANSVSNRPTAFTLAGRALALAGLGAAFVSTLWTVSYTKLAGRLARDPDTTTRQAVASANNIARVGIALNVVGMTLSILGAEAIVGVLAAKALTQTQSAVLGVAASPVQALDVLIMQASVNTIASHFAALVACLRLRGAATACADADADASADATS